MIRHARFPKVAAGILLSAALASFLTGITEPIEFAFMFVAPVLYLVHAILTGTALAVCYLLNIKIEQAVHDSAQLQEAYEKDAQIRQLIDTAKRLEGLVRNAGVHAAGVVISPRPLTDLVPLHKTKNDEIVTAFDMLAIEKLGLLKMDFLGLTTLTILDDTLKLIAQTRAESITLESIPL